MEGQRRLDHLGYAHSVPLGTWQGDHGQGRALPGSAESAGGLNFADRGLSRGGGRGRRPPIHYRFGAYPTVSDTITLRPGSKFNKSAEFGTKGAAAVALTAGVTPTTL